jgi:type IV fimbrial biogenesis protein FimT
MKIKSLKTSHGFTIIELLTTMAIAGVLIAIALPNYQAMVRNGCMTTSTNSLVASLQLARSEAIKNRTLITLEAGDITANNLWGTGWTVYSDDNNSNDITAGEEIRIEELTCGSGNPAMTIDANDNAAADISSFSYDASGFISDEDNGRFPITIDVCFSSGDTGRQISINTLGRPSTNSEYTCP